jgi:hypothetical protein
LDPEYNTGTASAIAISKFFYLPEAKLWAVLHFLACGGRESEYWLSSLEVLEGAEDSESLISALK